MPTLYVSESKRQIENISYFGDFRSVLSVGETIATSTVTIIVHTGTDPNPLAMLAGGITVHNGTVIEQHVRQGIPGVIYDILFDVVSTLGLSYSLTTRLAILPNANGANPVFNVQYETSTLYPYILSDSFIAYAPTIGTGKLFGVVQVEDGILASINVSTGVLTYQQYYYVYPLDGIISSISIGNGILTYQNYISYSDGPESIKAGIAILNGTLVAATQITYNIPYDAIQTSISIQNGTLT